MHPPASPGWLPDSCWIVDDRQIRYSGADGTKAEFENGSVVAAEFDGASRAINSLAFSIF
jgi:hypothetical protein